MTWELTLLFLAINGLCFWLGHNVGYNLARWWGVKVLEVFAAWAYQREPEAKKPDYKTELLHFFDDVQKHALRPK